MVEASELRDALPGVCQSRSGSVEVLVFTPTPNTARNVGACPARLRKLQQWRRVPCGQGLAAQATCFRESTRFVLAAGLRSRSKAGCLCNFVHVPYVPMQKIFQSSLRLPVALSVLIRASTDTPFHDVRGGHEHSNLVSEGTLAKQHPQVDGARHRLLSFCLLRAIGETQSDNQVTAPFEAEGLTTTKGPTPVCLHGGSEGFKRSEGWYSRKGFGEPSPKEESFGMRCPKVPSSLLIRAVCIEVLERKRSEQLKYLP